jgi:2-keto-3-deoxy-L-rhamnonate aldolase RhmA
MANLKKILNEGKVALGTWITIAHPDVVEALSTLQFDWFVFDMEHAPLDISNLEIMLMGLRGSDIEPIVRVPWNDMVVIKRVLDIGAKGLVVPWVNSREEAESAIRYTLYPPKGVRGAGPRRAVMYGAIDFLEYYRKFEEEFTLVIQIETEKALRNIEEIAAVGNIDIFYIGPMDLSVNLGIPLQYDHPKFTEAVETVLKTCKKYDITPGIHTFSIDMAEKYISMGFRFLALNSDFAVLRNSFASMLNRLSKYINK